MIWIIGEYAERIDNADELLESFLEGFHDENSQVQLQLLTAIVKLFLKRPSDTQELVQQVSRPCWRDISGQAGTPGRQSALLEGCLRAGRDSGRQSAVLEGCLRAGRDPGPQVAMGWV